MASGPDLLFGPGSPAGFTPAGIAAFDNLRPAAVVRELIQNALDAARLAEVTPAVVRFRLTEVSRDEVPGIQAYTRAFKKAVKTQESLTGGSLSGQAHLTAQTIQDALNEDHLDVLTVFDNGIGLDKTRMNALLSDGVSNKSGGATGTYGNGHSTAIPASDLRYILYGGLTENGRRIGAGHAVLASHFRRGQKHLCSGDGFFIRGFSASQRGALYDYATTKDMPHLIQQDLDFIKKETGHGTAVIIPAFNHFLENQDDLWSMVSHAASANFFVAIEERALVVLLEDNRPGTDKTVHTLSHKTLKEVLTAHRQRRRAQVFLNGRRAYEAHEVYREGAHHRIDTGIGRIAVCLRENPEGHTYVDFCRNGMWITQSLPVVHQNLADQVPFHAVLSLDASTGRELHDLIRIAEGPLHDAIHLKRLRPVSRKNKCRDALRKVRQWFLDNTRTAGSDSYSPDDFLSIDFGEAGDPGQRKASPSFVGFPVPIRRNASVHAMQFGSGVEHTGRPSRGGKKSTRHRGLIRPALPEFFRAVSRPVGPRRRRIWIECVRSCANAQLRLLVDEAVDATCERPALDAYTPAALSNVTIDGTRVADSTLIPWEGRRIGVPLGNLSEGVTLAVEVDYRLLGDFRGLEEPSLRIEVFRTESQSTLDRAGTDDMEERIKS